MIRTFDQKINESLFSGIDICGTENAIPTFPPDWNKTTIYLPEPSMKEMVYGYLDYLRSPIGIGVMFCLFLILLGMCKMCIEGLCCPATDLDMMMVVNTMYFGEETGIRPKVKPYW